MNSSISNLLLLSVIKTIRPMIGMGSNQNRSIFLNAEFFYRRIKFIRVQGGRGTTNVP